jgi:hypothetical protein
VYILFLVSASAFAIGEKSISLGGASSWNYAEYRQGITEVRSVRPYPVLVLSSADHYSDPGYTYASGAGSVFIPVTGSSIDMSLPFDEQEISKIKDVAGNYSLITSKDLHLTDRLHAKAGISALLFGGYDIKNPGSPLQIKPDTNNALFAPNSRIGDFSIEFWLNPLNLESGEEILRWNAGLKNHSLQNIQCVAEKNRLRWQFINFFHSPDGSKIIDIDLSGYTAVIPRNWSHHLIRFDSSTGMVEYLVDGVTQSILYATSSGREKGQVYTPVTGTNGIFILGERYKGILDEFKIHKVCVGRSLFQKYSPPGGRTETRPLDLGEIACVVTKIDVSGGCTSVKAFQTSTEFQKNGRFRFKNDSEMQFFLRVSNNPYTLSEKEWIQFTPGTEIQDTVQGRYAQLAIDFYPSSDGESTPYLDELRITYLSGEPPMPPRKIQAVAVDGGVMLEWKPGPDGKASGYLVYYSSVKGELFGKDASLGPSPIDVGNRTSILIDGLKNGVLYYFRVASYAVYAETANSSNIGEFSGEVTGRPLTGLVPTAFEFRN